MEIPSHLRPNAEYVPEEYEYEVTLTHTFSVFPLEDSEKAALDAAEEALANGDTFPEFDGEMTFKRVGKVVPRYV